MSTLRISAALVALVALAACGRAPTDPSRLAPSSASAARGADDVRQQPRQQPQPGDDKRGQGEVQPNDDKGQHAQPGDDRGRGGQHNDDPANHG